MIYFEWVWGLRLEGPTTVQWTIGLLFLKGKKGSRSGFKYGSHLNKYIV